MTLTTFADETPDYSHVDVIGTNEKVEISEETVNEEVEIEEKIEELDETEETEEAEEEIEEIEEETEEAEEEIEDEEAFIIDEFHNYHSNDSVKSEGLYIINSFDTSYYEGQFIPTILEIAIPIRNHLSLNGYDPDVVRIGRPFDIRNSNVLYFPVLDLWDAVLTFLVFDTSTLSFLSTASGGSFVEWMNDSGISGEYMIFVDSDGHIFAINETESILVHNNVFSEEINYDHDFRQEFIQEMTRSTIDNDISPFIFSVTNIKESILEIDFINQIDVFRYSQNFSRINRSFRIVGQGILPNRRCGMACLTSILMARGVLSTSTTLSQAYTWVNNNHSFLNICFNGINGSQAISNMDIERVLGQQRVSYSIFGGSSPTGPLMTFHAIDDVIWGGGAVLMSVIGGDINHFILTMGTEQNGNGTFIHVMDPVNNGKYDMFGIQQNGYFVYDWRENATPRPRVTIIH